MCPSYGYSNRRLANEELVTLNTQATKTIVARHQTFWFYPKTVCKDERRFQVSKNEANAEVVKKKIVFYCLTSRGRPKWLQQNSKWMAVNAERGMEKKKLVQK